MRILLLLFILLFGFGASGFFIVDEHEFAVISFDNNMQVFDSGLHWKFPFYGDLTYVYSNQRNSDISTTNTIRLKDGSQYIAEINMVWKVYQVQNYMKYIQSNSMKQFAIDLSQDIESKVLLVAKNSTSSTDFMQKLSTQSKYLLSNKGIEILSINITSIKFVDNKNQIIKMMSAESSYQFAQQVKLTAENKQNQQLNVLKQKNIDFFNFYMKINQLEQTARIKQDVPPLSAIYQQ